MLYHSTPLYNRSMDIPNWSNYSRNPFHASEPLYSVMQQRYPSHHLTYWAAHAQTSSATPTSSHSPSASKCLTSPQLSTLPFHLAPPLPSSCTLTRTRMILVFQHWSLTSTPSFTSNPKPKDGVTRTCRSAFMYAPCETTRAVFSNSSGVGGMDSSAVRRAAAALG